MFVGVRGRYKRRNRMIRGMDRRRLNESPHLRGRMQRKRSYRKGAHTCGKGLVAFVAYVIPCMGVIPSSFFSQSPRLRLLSSDHPGSWYPLYPLSRGSDSSMFIPSLSADTAKT